jgi:ABC transport system ATP-binding/permease protein
MSFKEQRELESLPARIAALETEQQLLQHESASPEFYKSSADHIRSVLARIQTVEADLHTALERWMELEALK